MSIESATVLSSTYDVHVAILWPFCLTVSFVEFPELLPI
jgi:hypothetical protein